MTRRAIIIKLEKLVANYYTQVYKKAHMKQGDGCVDECKPKRQLNKIWRYEVMNKLGVTNDSLQDIGKNMKMLKGNEKLFYEDQKSERIGRLSSDIDFQYEIEQEEIHLNENIALERETSQSKHEKYLFKQILLSSANQTYILKNVYVQRVQKPHMLIYPQNVVCL